MKKQRYIVEIEMPDGDFISADWLKDLIQADCDVEDESRKKVTVQETSLPSNLDEAAGEYSRKDGNSAWWLVNDEEGNDDIMLIRKAFKAGAKWMAGQGYRAAEKDNALTWEDVAILITIYEAGIENGDYRRYNDAEWMKEYSQDILRRFNEIRKK